MTWLLCASFVQRLLGRKNSKKTGVCVRLFILQNSQQSRSKKGRKTKQEVRGQR